MAVARTARLVTALLCAACGGRVVQTLPLRIYATKAATDEGARVGAIEGWERGVTVSGISHGSSTNSPAASAQIVGDTVRIAVGSFGLHGLQTRDIITYSWRIEVSVPHGWWNVEVIQGQGVTRERVFVGDPGVPGDP